jgi:hypothetical protein
MIAIVEDRDLTPGNGFVWFVKSNLHGLVSPAPAHRDGHCRHAMADLYARPKALVRKCGGRRRIAPYPRKIIRRDSRSEQRRMATSTGNDRKPGRENGEGKNEIR